MVFVRLVSSIEALSEFIELDKKDDLFKGKKFEDIVKTDVLSEKDELKRIFDVRKSRKKFIRFIERHSKGFFKGGRDQPYMQKLKKQICRRYLMLFIVQDLLTCTVASQCI